jgi:ATP-dependent helicase/nuclease subunit A
MSKRQPPPAPSQPSLFDASADAPARSGAGATPRDVPSSGDAPAELADAQARRDIEQRLDVNMVVEAGAGSGKTYSLASRMADGIATGRYSVGEMAAVTFTRKAAAELRARFQLRLEERLQDAAGDERARIATALADIEHLFAGTIHAFCARLLRERPVEAGVPPDFDELDEVDDERLRRQAWREFLAAEQEAESAAVATLRSAGLDAADLDGAFALVALYDEVEFPAPAVERPPVDRVWEVVEQIVDALRALMPDPLPADFRCAALKRAVELVEGLDVADPSRVVELVRLLEGWERLPAITMKWWAIDRPRAEQQAIKERVHALLEPFVTGIAGPFLGTWRQYVYATAIPLLVEAREHAREMRRRRGALNYNDLLQRAASLLAGNRDVRRAMQRKYRWLFVDEFQDTDPIQARVILALAADETGADGDEGCSPFECPLRPGALFIVGDPKQSIYRFRRADIAVYNEVRDRIVRDGGAKHELVTSFRSQAAVCSFVNEVFEQLIGREGSAEQPAFADLAPVQAAAAGAGVFTLTIDADTEQEAAEREARAIARVIAGDVAAGRRRWGDFLVLTRIRKRLPVIERALEDARVPFEVSGAGAFGHSPHVKQLRGLLAALAEPEDQASLVGVLRGPLFGLSDRALYAYRVAGGALSIGVPALGEDEEDQGGPVPDAARNVASAMRSLWAMVRWTRQLPLAAAVARIVEASGLLVEAAAAACDAAPAGDLLHAVDRVRRVAEKGGGLADALDALDADMTSNEVESVPLEPGRDDVVRVMNLHKAKGLEGRVVFLVDAASRPPRRPPDIRIVRRGDVAEGWVSLQQRFRNGGQRVIAEPADWASHVSSEMRFLDAEQTRLLYVATTRAREQLVVCRWQKQPARGSWGALEPWLHAARPVVVSSETTTAAVAAGSGPGANEWLETRRLALVRQIDVRERLARASYASDSVTSTAPVVRPVKEDDPARLLRGPATGVDWGVLVHRLLEVAVNGRATDRAGLERAGRWLVRDAPGLATVLDEAVDSVIAVMASPLWRDIATSPERHAEVPFAFSRPGATGVPVVQHGVIDLVYRAGEGWRLIDWKTDQVGVGDGSSLVRLYRHQLDAYVEAWARVAGAGAAPIEAGLFVVRTGQVHWVR